MTSVDLLRRQHAELRTLLHRVRESDARRLEIEFDAFCEAVRTHWRVEEEHLYPLLARFEYPELYRSIEVHRALRHVAHDLTGLGSAGPHFHSALKVLGAQLEQHISDEESLVLPFVAERVPRDEDDEAAHGMRETIAEIENENWIGSEHAWTNHNMSA
jgi:hemerythrin-like domain-containing protein